MKKIKTKSPRFRLSLPVLLVILFCIAVVVISVILQNNKSSYKSRAEDVQSKTEIISGHDAKPSEWPFVVKLVFWYSNQKGELLAKRTCTGSLIAQDWIVTTAHCLDKVGELSVNFMEHIQVYLYKNPQSDSPEMFNSGIIVMNVKKNTNYNRADYNWWTNDILLLNFRYKYPREMPMLFSISYTDLDLKDIIAKNPYVAVAGWGITTNDLSVIDPLPDKLKEIVMYVSSSNNDLDLIDLEMRNSQGIKKNGGECEGDSGAPIIASIDGKRYLAGIVVGGPTGIPCGDKSYALSIQKFTNWIESVTGVKPNSGTFTRNLPILPPNDRDMWWKK